jgi:membrane-bound lytic murein transglycosylase B
MQFLPTTWARYGSGGDIHDAHDAIAAAAHLLEANGATRDLSTALYHYNPSSHYVRGVLAFASAMAADIRSFYGYYGWQVYAATTAGTFLLPEGYGA